MIKSNQIFIKTTILMLCVINLVLLIGFFPKPLNVNAFSIADSQITTVSTIVEVEEVLMIQVKKVTTPEPQTMEEKINRYIQEITDKYKNVKPELVKSIIYHESRYNPNVSNGKCVGLMQISTRWHSDRAVKLGVTDFYDPYSNILLGVDYLSDLIDCYKDTSLVLMMYNMGHDNAFKLYSKGVTSGYAKSVLARAQDYKKGE